VFATIGQLSHDGHLSAGGYASDALPLLGAWWALALAGRGFVTTWLVGVTAGVAIRAAVLGHLHWNQLEFLAVALVFVGAVAAVLLKLTNLVQRPNQVRPKT
jgi:hypothetical protein